MRLVAAPAPLLVLENCTTATVPMTSTGASTSGPHAAYVSPRTSSSPTRVAGEWSGRVVSVADGVTITVDRGRTRVWVRLLGFDAPEVAHGSPAQYGPDAARSFLDRLW